MTLQQQKSDILSAIDFKRIQKVMKFLKWTYATDPGAPSIERLKSLAAQLLDDCIKEYDKMPGAKRAGLYCSSRTGGFEATLHYGALSLVFGLESHHVETDDATISITNP